ncbi:MAG: vWA domain-containing protein [Armatimonadota bacterium]
MSIPELEIRSLKAGRPSAGGRIQILIRAVAPERPLDWPVTARPPLDLALVIDRSGSMSGGPLHEAKRCALEIVRRLEPTDRAAVVVYDGTVDTLLPLHSAGDIAPFARVLARVDAGGRTNLHGGWDAGRIALDDGGRTDAVRRVLLLSDGCANHGITRVETVSAHCRRALEAGIGTTTIGLGRHFNEDLMTAMAEAGGGQSYYGERAEDLLDAFSEEFSLLGNLHSREMKVRITPSPGVRVVAVGGKRASGTSTIRLPDVAWGAVSWVQVTLEVPPSESDGEPLLVARLSGTSEDGRWRATEAALHLPTLEEPVLAALAEDPVVAERVADTRVGELLEEARAAAIGGDPNAARRLLGEARNIAGDNRWLHASVAEIEQLLEEDVLLFAKEARFARNKMAGRLLASEAVLADAVMPEYLQTKVRQGRRRD